MLPGGGIGIEDEKYGLAVRTYQIYGTIQRSVSSGAGRPPLHIHLPTYFST